MEIHIYDIPIEGTMLHLVKENKRSTITLRSYLFVIFENINAYKKSVEMEVARV